MALQVKVGSKFRAVFPIAIRLRNLGNELRSKPSPQPLSIAVHREGLRLPRGFYPPSLWLLALRTRTVLWGRGQQLPALHEMDVRAFRRNSQSPAFMLRNLRTLSNSFAKTEKKRIKKQVFFPNLMAMAVCLLRIYSPISRYLNPAGLLRVSSFGGRYLLASFLGSGRSGRRRIKSTSIEGTPKSLSTLPCKR